MTETTRRTGFASQRDATHGWLPWMRNCLAVACLTGGLAVGAHSAHAAPQVPDRFTDQLIAEGLDEPTGMAFLPDHRILVIQRQGAVRLVTDGKFGAIDPLFVCDSVEAGGDRGATGIVVDPRWPAKPYVYVYYDATDQTCKIVRYTVGGDLTAPSSLLLTVDPASRYTIIHDIPDLSEVHNGGTLRFGPDSMMYAGLGEDGNACAAQDTSTLRGVMIRIDIRGLPSGPGGPPDRNLLVAAGNPLASHPLVNARLVWADGLRNPFRFHFDSATGNIFLADVGFSSFEEIDQLTGSMPNFGWPYFEGPMSSVPTCSGKVQPQDTRAPIYAYDRTGFTASVISAGVYRGSACVGCNFPAEYEGDYFFSDFYEGFLRRLKFDGNQWALAPPVPGQPNSQDWGRGFEEAADFLQASDGSLWYVKMGVDFNPGSGEIHRIVFDSPLTDVAGSTTAAVQLASPHPTPSRGSVSLRYELPAAALVDLDVMDVQGRLVHTISRGSLASAGVHHGTWNGMGAAGTRVAPGVYLARLHAGSTTLTRRIIIIQ